MWTMWCALASAGPVAYVGATVHPVSAPPIERGVVLVDDGKVVAVGPAAEVSIPDGATTVDLTGKVVVPGFVDSHSHIGGARLSEGSGPLIPQVSAVDSFDATHVSIRLAQAGGVTTANVMPGSGNLIGGQTAYVKLRDAAVIDDMLFCADRRTAICGGMKMANGTNPQRGGAYPRSRMGALAQLRQRLLDVRRKMPGPRRGLFGTKPPPRSSDVGEEALRQVLRGDRVLHFHTHRADDVATILALRDEFGLNVVLHHVSEAWKVVEQIWESGVKCSLIVIDSPGGKEEAVEFRATNPMLLANRGLSVSLHTDDPITDSRLFLRSAGLAVRSGMSEARALRALTLAGAEQLGLEDRVGSLEVGKDADFVVLSGPPLSVWTHVEATYIDGTLVFDRSDPTDQRYAEGGYDVADRVPGRVQ